jgi:Phage integrase family/Acyl-CoA dehydrogenase, middle domain/Acyl-CoA dehydrogenase, N-terminal domain
MTYRAPINDMLLALHHGAGLQAAVKAGHYGDFDSDIAAAVLEEAGRFASDVLAPLNRIGDENGIKLEGGQVTTAPGWPDAYRRWTEAGWNAVSGSEAFGGQGLPLAINAACTEIWSASNMAFGLCPLLTLSAIEALDAHGSEELKKIYLEKLISGAWTGTMQLTEPQAGSDVGALRTRAEHAADGSYRLSGTKIFITYGDHDMTDNIVHFVLARLPDAPAGTKGISLFLVPKFLVNADGSLGARNDIYPSGIEHKLGIHASPTCTMTMGDKGGAVGYLIGEENRGMLCMFTMMNQAGPSRGYVIASPCIHLDKLDEEYPRDRVLTEGEIGTLWHGLERKDLLWDRTTRLAIKFALVTMLRSGELLGIQRDELNPNNGTVDIPARRVKKRRVINQPLSDLALEILTESMGNHSFAFVGRFGNAPLARQAMSGALKGTKHRNGKVKTPGICELLGLKPFTPHDLRRTAATMCGNLGLSESAISQCLDHQATKGEDGQPLPAITAKIYNLSVVGRVERKRKVLDA